jgi:nucleotide-binding universal stress UspA family protein
VKIICALGLQNGPELLRRAAAATGGDREWVLLHVIDTGPRHGLEAYLRGGLPGRAHDVERHTAAAADSEAAAAEAVVQEAQQAGRALGLAVRGEVRSGPPEQVIAAMAGEIHAELIVIMASEGTAGRPQLGPASVGHVARFVLDHAPCDVLLLRGAP